MKFAPWTPRDIEFLRDNVNKMTNREIGLELDRSENAVGVKAHFLGITRDPEVYARHRSKSGKDAGGWKGGVSDVDASVIRNYARKNREKTAAWARVRRALKSGRLVKHACEVCGNPKVDAHHDDYSKAFDVRWLCRLHHNMHHRAMEKSALK